MFLNVEFQCLVDIAIQRIFLQCLFNVEYVFSNVNAIFTILQFAILCLFLIQHMLF